MIAFHGFSGCGQDFEANIAGTRRLLDWITPDLPGHGARPGPVPAWSATLDSIGEAFPHKPAEETILLGYSMGGRILLGLLPRLPWQPDAVVLIGANPGIRDQEERRRRRQADQELSRRIEDRGVADFLEFWRRNPLIATQEQIPQPWKSRLHERRMRNRASGLVGALRHLGTGSMPDLRGSLAAIASPTLLVSGESDTRYCSLNVTMASLIPRASAVVIPGAGHAAHLENPPLFEDALVRFLQAETILRPTASSPA